MFEELFEDELELEFDELFEDELELEFDELFEDELELVFEELFEDELELVFDELFEDELELVFDEPRLRKAGRRRASVHPSAVTGLTPASSRTASAGSAAGAVVISSARIWSSVRGSSACAPTAPATLRAAATVDILIVCFMVYSMRFPTIPPAFGRQAIWRTPAQEFHSNFSAERGSIRQTWRRASTGSRLAAFAAGA